MTRVGSTEPEYEVVVTAEEQQRAEELGEELPATLPVLPLKETVVFPESMTPLAIGQERSIRLIDDVVGGDRLLALVTVRDEDAEIPGWDELHEVGTAAVGLYPHELPPPVRRGQAPAGERVGDLPGRMRSAHVRVGVVDGHDLAVQHSLDLLASALGLGKLGHGPSLDD